MNKVWFNGRFAEREQISLDSADRAWRFADGGFETFFFNGREAPYYELHRKRAGQHAQTIGAELHIPDQTEVNQILNELARQNGNPGFLRVRLSWFRNPGVLYLPTDKSCSIIIEAWNFDPQSVKRELSACFYADQPLAFGKLSPFKKIGCAVYTDAISQARLKGFDEAVLLNTQAEVAECSSSNIIIRMEDTFISPPIEAGAVEGVMLQIMEKRLPELGYRFERKTITQEDLLGADEILSVNALRGICCLILLNNKHFSSESLNLNAHLNLG